MAKVTVSQEELKKYVSLSTVQTKGLKRYLRESEEAAANIVATKNKSQEDDIVINTLKGAKRRRLALAQQTKEEKVSNDPNVLGLEVSKH